MSDAKIKDAKVVSLQDRKDQHNGCIQILEKLLADAKSGELVGFCGVFLYDKMEGQDGPVMGTLRSELVMDEQFYPALGALEQLKFEMLCDASHVPID